MVTGVIAEIVEDIPAVVYFSENNERLTPIKGPKKEPRVIDLIASLSFKASLTSLNFFKIINNIVKLIKPEIILIWVAARKLYSPIPNLLKTSPKDCPKDPRNAKNNPFTEWLTLNLLSSLSLLNITMDIPIKVIIIPIKPLELILSFRKIYPNKAVMGGDVAIIKEDTLTPISRYD